MASVLTFDELNRLDYEGRRSEDYEEYFSGMGLTKQQIGERIELAKNFEKELMPVLIYLNTLREYGLIDEEDAEAVINCCRENNIKEFTISSNSTGMIRSIMALETQGCRLVGTATVNRENAHFDDKKIPAIKMEII